VHVGASKFVCVCVCTRGGREGAKEICLLAQPSHQTDLPQSVLPLLCQNTRLSLSRKRQPIGKPLTLWVTAIAMVTVGVWWGETVDHVTGTAALPNNDSASRLPGSCGIKTGQKCSKENTRGVKITPREAWKRKPFTCMLGTVKASPLFWLIIKKTK